VLAGRKHGLDERAPLVEAGRRPWFDTIGVRVESGEQA
jgi:hypothetical protein